MVKPLIYKLRFSFHLIVRHCNGRRHQVSALAPTDPGPTRELGPPALAQTRAPRVEPPPRYQAAVAEMLTTLSLAAGYTIGPTAVPQQSRSPALYMDQHRLNKCASH